MKLIEDKIFEKIDYTIAELTQGIYENCKFIKCNFHKVDLSNISFRECLFENCDLSLAKTTNTGMKEIEFIGCKLVGVQFNDCNQIFFTIRMKDCVAKFAVFYQAKLKKTLFSNCNLQEVDFTEADLNGSDFSNCDLSQATFHNSNLENVDFRTAYNYSFDPEINRIKKAKFSRTEVIGLLSKYRIIIE